MSNLIEFHQAPELWGGLECTINRVGDDYIDQLQLGKLYTRDADIDAILSTGVKAIRFPVLWEKHQPTKDTTPEFSWAETQLDTLRGHGINPIIGLIHHGSGPEFTNLLDEDFAEKLACYARHVASKFPWVTDYTPVNEPLTTARFSGLYGLWYPHKTNDVSFIRMLLNQLKGVVLSMKAIRAINGNARLIQTEDLGKTYSTQLLTYQADFENHRRWLTFDILTGKFDNLHPLWNYFMRLGIEESSMKFFVDNPCPPHIIGVNHYLTSERYLDEKVHKYPPQTRGGNGLHDYADVEAVRVNLQEPHGAEVLLREITTRYRLPIAITEVQLHCTREEQLRWFEQIYGIARKLNNEGLPILAVTAWSMFGSFGWNKLLTGEDHEYETGVFDISAGYARPTALAHLLRSITAKNFPAAELCRQPGWWVRPSRHTGVSDSIDRVISPVKPVLILGAHGKLGTEIVRQCALRHIHYLAPVKHEVDIGNSSSIEKCIVAEKPWAIINAAGFVNVDEAEIYSETCYRLNTLGPQKLAILCEEHKIKLVSFSSDLVFDGVQDSPYLEDHPVHPLSTYGKSKAHAETFLTNVSPSSLIIRSSAFFGPGGKGDFVSHILYHLNRGLEVSASNEQLVSPTYVPHLVEATLNLLIDDACGIWHLANKGEISWYDFARRAATMANFDPGMIKPLASESAAPRPAYSALGSIKYGLMPTLETGMEAYFSHELVNI
jgi:dTDP-4-dehydrorhamnose reductase